MSAEFNQNGKRPAEHCQITFPTSDYAKFIKGQELVAQGQKLIAEAFAKAIPVTSSSDPIEIDPYVEPHPKKRVKTDRKKTVTGYLLFCKEMRGGDKIDSNLNPHQVVTFIGQEWQKLSEDEKGVYNAQAKVINEAAEHENQPSPPASPASVATPSPPVKVAPKSEAKVESKPKVEAKPEPKAEPKIEPKTAPKKEDKEVVEAKPDDAATEGEKKKKKKKDKKKKEQKEGATTEN